MAPLTESAEFAAMGVLIPVAFDALHGWFLVFVHGVKVAGHTIEADMRAFEDKPALPVVVKGPEFPTVRIVAIGAFHAEPLLVGIFSCMAAVAVSRCILEGS